MSKLADDLEFYGNEAYYRRDLKAGIKLIAEIAGAVSLGSLLLSILFVWLPGIGIPITAAVAIKVLKAAAEGYVNLDSEDRKKVRAVVRWTQGGIRLLD
jgi:hypothetical protein